MYDSQMICFSHCVAVGKQIRRQSGGEDVELQIMHPTMSSSQMVVGSVFSGMQFTKLMKAYCCGSCLYYGLKSCLLSFNYIYKLKY